MLDSHLYPRLKPALNRIASRLDKPGITPNGLTVVGFAIGSLALPLLALHYWTAALAAILVNRLFDGLDGALARRRGLSRAGGFLDIALDFLFYGLVPFGFVLADPATNALPGAFLLLTFIGTGSSFLAFATLASQQQLTNPRYPHKSFYYLGGLTEGTETLAVFVAMTLFPHAFALLAWIFGTLCCLTTLTRVWGGFQTLRQSGGETPPDPGS